MNGDLSYTETGFVKGYWERYEMKPRPRGKEAREGWDQCNRELKEEASAAKRKSSKADE